MAGFFRIKNPEKKKKDERWNKALDEVMSGAVQIKREKRKYTIHFDNVSKVNRFVLLCSRAPVEVVIYDENGMSVPGDSIMGIFALNLVGDVRIDVSGGPRDIESFIEKAIQEDISISLDGTIDCA